MPGTPEGYGYFNKVRDAAMKRAISEVKAKFPDLKKGTSGWSRAVENRFKRIYH